MNTYNTGVKPSDVVIEEAIQSCKKLNLSVPANINTIVLDENLVKKWADKYGSPVSSILIYIARAVEVLWLDNNIVNNWDAAMYAHRLSYNADNLNIARTVLHLPEDANLSQVAVAMSHASKEKIATIELDHWYTLPRPRDGMCVADMPY